MKTNSLFRFIMCCSLLTTMACFDKDNNTGDSAEPDDSGEIQDSGSVVDTPVCADLSPDECSSNELCIAIDGIPQIPDEEDACFNPGESTAVGCMDIDSLCSDALTFAQADDNSGYIHLFLDTCIPEGWSTLNLFDYQVCEDEPASCAEKTPEQCVMDDSCEVISGVPQIADNNEACYHPGESADLGCRDAGMACNEAMTFGIPSDNSTIMHLFNNSCLPTGWESIDILLYEVCED